ncbi:MAG TPA: H-NS histone family protein, partial [Rubrivivax sp.]|nr:H-NS histone family protein [Rubrivivax sp.]
KRRKPSANAGKKVAPKYRDPATGDTWTGRGLKPKWLAAALNSGRSLSEFAL